MKSFKIGLLGPAFTYSDLAIQSQKFTDFLKTKQAGKKYSGTSENRWNARRQGGSDATVRSCTVRRKRRSRHSSTRFSEVPSVKFFISITDTIEALKKKQIDFAVVPIENSTYGTVRETEDTIFKNESRIIFAFSLEIHHALLTKKETRQENIKRIYAHKQAMEQCGKFLRKYFQNAQKIGMGSSGQALEYIANQKEKGTAAIGPEIAAEKYNLKIIRKNIENEKQNRTMFLILAANGEKSNILRAQNASAERDEKSGSASSEASEPMIKLRTSIAFWFSNDRPGSLYEVLREFAKAKLNLTKIESRPASKKLGEYIFFLDFDGDEKDKKVEKVLQKLKKITAGFKSFGSYQVH